MIAAISKLTDDQEIYLKILCLFCLGYPIYSWFGTWCLIVLLVVWLLNTPIWIKRFELRQIHWPFILYFLIHLFGLIYSENFSRGVDDLQSKSAFILIPLVFATLSFSKRQILKIVRYFVLGTLLASLIYLGFAAYRYFVLQETSDVFFYSVLTTPFKNHPAYISSYCIFSLIYLSLELTYSKVWNNVQRNGIRILISFFWFMVILYAGRMQILTLCSIVSLFFIWIYWKDRAWLKMLFGIAFIWIITFVTSSSFNYTSERVEGAIAVDAPTNIRFELWQVAIDLGKENPILGVGTGDVESSLMERYISEEILLAVEKGFNTHNQYLQSLVTLGGLGLLSYLLVLFFPGFRSVQNLNFLILGFYLIFILGTLTECMLETQRGSVWLAVFGSLFWGREDFLADQHQP